MGQCVESHFHAGASLKQYKEALEDKEYIQGSQLRFHNMTPFSGLTLCTLGNIFNVMCVMWIRWDGGSR